MATVSLLHVIFGFTTGMAFASLLHVADRYRLYNAIEKAKDEKFKQDLYVDELNERIEYLEERTEELESHVNKAVQVLTSSLPAPSRNEHGCLDRQTQCVEEEFEFTLQSSTD